MNKLYTMQKGITLFIVFFCLLTGITNAQVSITNSTPYTQDFNSLPNTGASTTTNPNPPNWYRYAKTTDATKLAVGDGTENAGGFYSAGKKDSTDRALGSLLSATSKPLYFGVKFVNNTGSTIVSATVSYRCEQWRRGNKNAGVKDSLFFEYSSAADSVHKGTWTRVSNLAGSSTNSSSVIGALNGNTNFTAVAGNITGMNIPNGATFWIRFNDFDVTPDSDDLLAVDDFSIAFTTGTIAACTEPANSVSNVQLTPTGTTSLSGSFTGTTPASDGYLVLLDSSSVSITPTIVDANYYTLGQVLISKAEVISNGSTTTFNATGLVPNTNYKVYVFPYNNSGCSGGPNYKSTSPGTATAKTQIDACPEPTAKPTMLAFTQVTETSIKGKFNKTNPAPNGYVVVYSTSSNVGYPVDSSTYNVGDSIKYSSYKSKVAYVGTDSNFTVNGLISGTKYYFAVLPYNICGTYPNYNRTSPLRADTTTAGTPPLADCTQPSGINLSTVTKVDSTENTITIKWRNSVSDSIMIVAGPTNTIGFVSIRDSVYYAVGSTISGSQAKVYFRGTDSTLVLTGLLSNTVYKILFATFNNKNCTNGPNYSGVANITIRTAAGSDCVQPSGVSNTSIIKVDSTSSSITVKWTNPTNADSVMIMAGPNLTIGFVSVRDSVYYAVGSTIPGSQAIVYYRGKDSTVTITGLTANTVYKILFATFNNKNCTNGPNYSGVASTTIRTAITNGVKYNNVEAEFALYPNPTSNGSLFVKFKTPLREPAVIEVMDVLGRNLSTQKIAYGTDMQTIDVSNFARGTYLLNVVYKGSNNVSTFIVE